MQNPVALVDFAWVFDPAKIAHATSVQFANSFTLSIFISYLM
jgi:hypothetical protein